VVTVVSGVVPTTPDSTLNTLYAVASATAFHANVTSPSPAVALTFGATVGAAPSGVTVAAADSTL
jgi:hypothetical protein